MTLEDLNGKLVAVLGYAKEGKATAKYLLKHGVKPVLFDQKPWEEWSLEKQEEIKTLGVQFIFGSDAFMELRGFDVAFRSPGVALGKVTSDKLQVTSQTKWFFEHSPAKIIGVTGTKGKGTTCSLIHAILQEQSRKWKIESGKSYLTGNIGEVQPFEILDNLTADDIVVYELSSFQLQDLTQSPHIGVVLMVTEDHMEIHSSLEEYHEAKTTISKFQNTNDFAVVNADFETSKKIGNLGKGQKVFFSRKEVLESGCYIDNGQVVVKNVFGSNFQFPISNIQLRGAHNLENICAAAVVACLLKISSNVIRESIESFKGLEHRLEFVAKKGGIKYYNDSISTIPDPAIAAIKSFIEPEIVILGGSFKNSDFTALGKIIVSTSNIKALILIGQEAGKIQNAIDAAGKINFKILAGATNMEEVFSQIKQVAAAGDVVLLSPACASFGMFKNYQDRGEQFKRQVMALGN